METSAETLFPVTAPYKLLYISSLCRVTQTSSLQTASTPQEPIYRPRDEILDISVSKTEEDLSRPLYPSVYQGEVLRRQLTFSLAFPMCSILLLASLLPISFFVFCSYFLLICPLPVFSMPLPLYPEVHFFSLISFLSSLTANCSLHSKCDGFHMFPLLVGDPGSEALSYYPCHRGER